MDSTAVKLLELGKEAMVGLYAQIQAVAPEVWEMTRVKVVAEAWIMIILPLAITISSLIALVIVHIRAVENDDLQGVLIIVFAVAVLTVLLISSCGVYQLIAQDYCTLQAVIGLVK